MKIRRATLDDVNIIAKYNYNLALETEDKKLDMNILTNGVKRLIEDESKGVYHVCEIDGKIVGQGTFEELMRTDDYFVELYNASVQ